MAAVVAAALVVCAKAGDFGSPADLRAIRTDATVLLGHVLAPPIHIDEVVVAGDDALATWHSNGKPGIATFRRQSDRWWLVATFDTFSPAIGRDVAEVSRDLSIPMSLAQQAEKSVPNLVARQPILRPVLPLACAACLSTLWDSTGGFESTLSFNATASTWDPAFALRGRVPAQSEMPPAPGAKAYFFFRFPKCAAPVGVRDRATLDVWFPFVLDPSMTYVLRIDAVVPAVRSVRGTLRDNTLHFVLPAFATTPGKDASGEIDGA